MTKRLKVTLATLEQHRLALGALLADCLDHPGGVGLDVQISGDGAVGRLLGPKAERVGRERGPDTPVLPLRSLVGGLWAWVGYREEWLAEGQGSYAFRSAGLTIHFGFLGDADKPQILRAEWAGWHRWAGATDGFAAGGAGHPHWQFDALESISSPEQERSAHELLALLREEQGDVEVVEFAPHNPGAAAVREMVRLQQLSALHLASAAPWWRKPPGDIHSHAPAVVAEVQRWTARSLSYLKAELGRLTP